MALNSVIRAGVSLHCRVDGDTGAPTLVYLNSLGTDLRLWDDVVAALPGCRHIRFDARGHGLSDCPNGPYSLDDLTQDALAVVRHFEAQPVILVGCSIGGVIAQDLTARYPDLVQGLVLSNTAARIGTLEMWNDRRRSVEAGGLEALADAILTRWFAPAFLASPAGTLWRRMLLATPANGYAATCGVLGDVDLSVSNTRITQPTLVVAGSEDQATPADLVASLVESIANADYALMDGVGHLPAAEDPAAFVTLLRKHLTRIRGSDVHSMGMATRRSVLGDAHVDRSVANMTVFDADFQTFITGTAWGQVWSRPDLDRPTRSLITLAMLAALGREAEFAMHIRAARNTGATPPQIREALLHVALYAGLPAANAAIGLAKQIYAEDGVPFDG